MDILSSLPLEWTPIYPMQRKDVVFDVFKHKLSYKDGLPPYAQARIIELIANRLIKARPRACLWISLDTPGRWYVHEILRLVKRKMPMVILPAGKAPKDPWNFTPHGIPSLAENTPMPKIQPPFDPADFGYKPNLIRVLRILARLETAHKPEIASMAGFSETHIRGLLKKIPGSEPDRTQADRQVRGVGDPKCRAEVGASILEHPQGCSLQETSRRIPIRRRASPTRVAKMAGVAGGSEPKC